LKHNGRTSTVKLRGCISQGLILDVPKGNWKEGDDVAKELGITKYEVPEPSFSISGNQTSKKKPNPYFDKYTEIENIKNFTNVFKGEDEVVVTEKIHGTNARYGLLPMEVSEHDNLFNKLRKWFVVNIMKKTHEFCYGSHNVQLTVGNSDSLYDNNVYAKIAKKYDFKKYLCKDMIIYGEIFGKGIQDLTYGRKDISFRVFDIKLNGKYADWDFVEKFCDLVRLPHVPVLYKGAWYDGLIADYTDGNSVIQKDQIREGIVIKPLKEENNSRLGRKILKSVSVAYLTRKNGSEYK
jgi:RNA ligase (TIGR02306 family)